MSVISQAALGDVAFDCVSQSVHTGGSGQALRHGGHHIRVNDCDDRDIVGSTHTNLRFLLYVGDNVVDGNLCSGTCCSRNGDDRYARFLGRCDALKASDILKLRVSMMMPMALAVSMEEPPPMAIR